MADLRLEKGNTVLLAFTVIDPQPDGDGDIVEGADLVLSCPFEHLADAPRIDCACC